MVNTSMYRRRRVEQQNNTHLNSEYIRFSGKLSQTNVPYSVRQTIEQRM